MKTTVKLSAFLIIAIIFSSCGSTPPQVAKNFNSLYATVNGSAFISGYQTTGAQGPVIDNAVKTGNQFTFTASSSSNSYIVIVINNYTGAPGTFAVTSAGTSATAAYNTGSTGAADIIANNGTITITRIDTTSYTNGNVVWGTFSFTAGTFYVTSGTFSVLLPK